MWLVSGYTNTKRVYVDLTQLDQLLIKKSKEQINQRVKLNSVLWRVCKKNRKLIVCNIKVYTLWGHHNRLKANLSFHENNVIHDILCTDNGKKKSVLVDPEAGDAEGGHFALYEVRNVGSWFPFIFISRIRANKN